MATVNKNFRIKTGLVVEGATATVNGEDVLTKAAADQSYIVNLIGGTATSANTANTVVKRDSNGDFAAGTITANITGQVSDISNHDTGDLAEGSNLYFTNARAQAAVAGDIAAAQSAAEAFATSADNALYGTVTTDISTALSTANSNAQGYANTAESNAISTASADATSKANTAEQNAKDYADGLASNYDAAGSAATAESNANDYTDAAITTEVTARNSAIATAKSEAISDANSYTDTAVANLVDGAPALLDTLNELAAAIADNPNYATDVANLVASKADTTYVDSEISDLDTAAQGYASAAQAAAEATAAADATTKANAAQAAAEATAAADATTKANAAQAAAEATAAADATTKANAAQAAAEATAAAALTAHGNDTTGVHGITDTSKLALLDAADQTFTGNMEVDGNLVVDGNFTVNGTNFSASATSIVIEDNLVQLAHQNSANTVDLGIVVAYNDGAAKHAGLVRDVSDAKWKLFKGVTTEPATTVDFTEGSLDDLKVAAFEATTVTPSSGVVFSDGTQTKAGVPSITPITEKTANYTLSSLTERDTLIEVNHTGGTAVTITIPSDATVNYPVGTSIDILRTNTGEVTIAGSGATVNATPGLKLRAQWSTATLFKRGANSWVVFGDLKA